MTGSCGWIPQAEESHGLVWQHTMTSDRARSEYSPVEQERIKSKIIQKDEVVHRVGGEHSEAIRLCDESRKRCHGAWRQTRLGLPRIYRSASGVRWLSLHCCLRFHPRLPLFPRPNRTTIPSAARCPAACFTADRLLPRILSETEDSTCIQPYLAPGTTSPTHIPP